MTEQWKPSNVEPLHKVLPDNSTLHAGVSKLDEILFAFCNTDLKPAILLYGLDGNPTHLRGIYDRVEPLLSDLWSKDCQPGNIVRAIRAFMCPPGFVQEPSQNYFITTQQGEAAKDSAAFLLKKSVDLGIPFGPVLHERTEDRNSPTRAYITRITTMIALKDGSLPQVKLHERMGGLVPSLSWNLRILSARKLIVYDAVDNQKKGQNIFQRADLTKMPPKASILTRNVFKYFQTNEKGNKYVIAQALGKTRFEGIAKVLHELAQAGVVEHARWEWGDHISDAQITPLGERFIKEVIVPLLLAYSGDKDSMLLLSQARKELEDNPAIATQALDQYKTQRTTAPEAETQEGIIAFLREHGPQRRRIILSHFGTKAHPQLLEMIEYGRLKKVMDGKRVSFYMLPDSDAQPKRVDEMIELEFSSPVDLIDVAESRKRSEYRANLDTVEFWEKLQAELAYIRPDRYPLRTFLLQYDPKNKDWEHGNYSGVFSRYIWSFWELGIEKPWDFIRTYNLANAPVKLQEAIKTTQDLINKVFPIEAGPRLFNKRYMDRLETPEFWRELISDVQTVLPKTTIEAFLLLFDPSIEGKMKPRSKHGKYYNFRAAVRKHTSSTAAVLLTTYQAPPGASLETRISIREAQAALREYLVIKNAPPDDFSDIPLLKKQQEEEIKRQKEKAERLPTLKSFFEKEFNDAEVTKLTTTTAKRVNGLRINVKGHDIDEASLVSIGFEATKLEGDEIVANTFPTELKAAYLVYAFEQWRNGGDIPRVVIFENQHIFKNGEVRRTLHVLEKYLTHYENQARKKNPNAILPASILVSQLQKHVFALK